jgi:hypothetical protein
MQDNDYAGMLPGKSIPKLSKKVEMANGHGMLVLPFEVAK